MGKIWKLIQAAAAATSGALAFIFGGLDNLMIALIIFSAVDYITGVIAAIMAKKLSSSVGFKGILKKVLMFLVVGVANVVDTRLIGAGSAFRTATIIFYLSNEGVSLLENAGRCGLPIPKKLKDILTQLHDKDEKGE